MGNLESERVEFKTESLEKLRQRLRHARAMLRSVMVAIRAIEDGCVNFGSMEVDADAQRWSPLTAVVRNELIAVRDTCVNSVCDSPVAEWDWLTPLAQIEALDAALWYGVCMPSGDGLDNLDVFDAAEAIVGTLDALLDRSLSSTVLPVRQASAGVAVAH